MKQRSTTFRRGARLLAAAGIVAGTLAPAGAAVAVNECYPNCGTPPAQVNPQAQPSNPIEVAGATEVRSGSLAFTGGDIAGLVAIGTGAAAVGGVMVARSRRRQHA